MNVANIQSRRRRVSPYRKARCDAGYLAGLGHRRDKARNMPGVPLRGQAPAGNEKVVNVLRHQGAVRNFPQSFRIPAVGYHPYRVWASPALAGRVQDIPPLDPPPAPVLRKERQSISLHGRKNNAPNFF